MLVASGLDSFPALLGILSLVGIVVNNAMKMLDQIAVERAGGMGPYEAVVSACLARLRIHYPAAS